MQQLDQEMDVAIRKIAKEEATHMIDITIGEYMPMEGSEISVDFDSAGLTRWAKNRFGIEIDPAELREGGARERREVQNALEVAAFDQIDNADLEGLTEFVDRDYGAHELAAWVKRKFAFEVDPAEIIAARDDDARNPRDPILEKARELYNKREVEYPVEFMMELTMMLARQNPQQAFAELRNWARNRFGIEMTEDEIKKTPPQKIAERFREAQREFVEEDRLNKTIDEALAVEGDDELDAFLTERLGSGVTPRMRFLEDDERDDAIRARVENLLRSELLYFERTILLETLDTAWKDHLYEMDKLRDVIGFRAFSQVDPKIQYKREGAQLFNQMLEGVRDKVTDYIFKARISPAAALGAQMGAGGAAGGPRMAPPQGGQAQGSQAPAPRPPAQRPPAARAGSGMIPGSSIVGPGFAMMPPPAAQPSPKSQSESDQNGDQNP